MICSQVCSPATVGRRRNPQAAQGPCHSPHMATLKKQKGQQGWPAEWGAGYCIPMRWQSDIGLCGSGYQSPMFFTGEGEASEREGTEPFIQMKCQRKVGHIHPGTQLAGLAEVQVGAQTSPAHYPTHRALSGLRVTGQAQWAAYAGSPGGRCWDFCSLQRHSGHQGRS